MSLPCISCDSIQFYCLHCHVSHTIYSLACEKSTDDKKLSLMKMTNPNPTAEKWKDGFFQWKEYSHFKPPLHPSLSISLSFSLHRSLSRHLCTKKNIQIKRKSLKNKPFICLSIFFSRKSVYTEVVSLQTFIYSANSVIIADCEQLSENGQNIIYHLTCANVIYNEIMFCCCWCFAFSFSISFL